MILCPYCGSDDYKTINSRNNNFDTLYVHRRKECNNCNKRFSTVEITKELFDKYTDKEEQSLQELKRIEEKLKKAENYEKLKKYICKLESEES